MLSPCCHHEKLLDCLKVSVFRFYTYFAFRTAIFWVIKQRVLVIPHWRFGTTYPFHLHGSWIILRSLPLKMAPIVCSEMSVRDYHCSLCTNPEERGSHLLQGRNLVSRMVCLFYIAHLPQQCHKSKRVIFQERLLTVLKCHNFLWVQRRHNCSPAASFTNCVMTLYLLKVYLQTFLSVQINKKCQILSCDTLVASCTTSVRRMLAWVFRLFILLSM